MLHAGWTLFKSPFFPNGLTAFFPSLLRFSVFSPGSVLESLVLFFLFSEMLFSFHGRYLGLVDFAMLHFLLRFVSNCSREAFWILDLRYFTCVFSLNVEFVSPYLTLQVCGVRGHCSIKVVEAREDILQPGNCQGAP